MPRTDYKEARKPGMDSKTSNLLPAFLASLEVFSGRYQQSKIHTDGFDK
jgi:hypothetical protein